VIEVATNRVQWFDSRIFFIDVAAIVLGLLLLICVLGYIALASYHLIKRVRVKTISSQDGIHLLYFPKEYRYMYTCNTLIIGLDDGEWLWKAERKGPATRRTVLE